MVLKLVVAMNGHSPSSRHAGPSYTMPLYDTTAMTSALANPYAQQMSPHYYQAYMQACRPRATADGYTLSSTYVPGTAGQLSRARPLSDPSPRDRPNAPQAQSPSSMRPIQNPLTFGSWYQPGNCRCTRPGCPFTGSRKSLEIHLMDRHLVFPPGWEERKKGDWDADPSLRGKPIVIQGTLVVLDTPEAVEAWIAERQRRFPTHARVEDKKRKLEEAVARGQLDPENMGARARKRHKQTTTCVEGGSRGVRGKGHQRGRGRREGMVRPEEPRREPVDDTMSQLADTTGTREASPGSASTADDGEAPEVVSSKAPTASLSVSMVNEHDRAVPRSHISPQECPRRTQPKKPPRNPFASRPTLLRNLLLPEIRITVSNLSQAIRFLVENDFLRGVELRPGEAQEQMIEVLDADGASGSATTPPTPEDLQSAECRL